MIKTFLAQTGIRKQSQTLHGKAAKSPPSPWLPSKTPEIWQRLLCWCSKRRPHNFPIFPLQGNYRGAFPQESRQAKKKPPIYIPLSFPFLDPYLSFSKRANDTGKIVETPCQSLEYIERFLTDYRFPFLRLFLYGFTNHTRVLCTLGRLYPPIFNM